MNGRGYRWYVVVVLTLVGVLNVVDRQILAILLEPIKEELGASDTQMGFLTGFAFVLFYSLASLPLARVADQRRRVTLITTCVAVWSSFTILAGRVANFGQLALARFGLGIGEAGSGPASQSIVADYFGPEERALPMAFIAASVPIGLMVSFFVGGYLVESVGWRATLFWVGAPGLVLGAVVGLTVREPARGASEHSHAEVRSYGLSETLSDLWSLRSFRWIVLGASLDVFAGYVLLVWSPSYLMRVHGMGPAEAGAWLGTASGVGGIAGTFLGGAFAQRMGRTDLRWLLKAPALTCALAAPCAFLFLTMPGQYAPYFFFGVMFFGPAMYGPVLTLTQGLAKVRMRAMAAAILTLLYSLIGIGLGPLATGMLSDALTPSLGDHAIRYAMGLSMVGFLGATAAFLMGSRHLEGDLPAADSVVS